MTQPSQRDETTRLENSTYNILRGVGTDADFLYDTVDTYINDAHKASRSDLDDMWNTIKRDRQTRLDKHSRKIRERKRREDDDHGPRDSSKAK